MDVLIMPFTGEVKLQSGTKENPDAGYRSRFSHDKEWASPGYYKVNLSDYDITAELTATPRCGFHKYTFSKSDSAHIILDLSHHYSTDSIKELTLDIKDNHMITGIRKTKGWGDPGELYWSNQQIYFVACFSKPFDAVTLFSDDVLVTDSNAKGKNIKAVIDYKTTRDEQVLIKVGVSSVSIENALLNLTTEIPDWDFNKVLANVQNEWEDELSKIIIDAPEKEKTIFYTALYHSLLAPYLFNDVNQEYIGFDGKKHLAAGYENYTVMSLWDTFRAANPLLTVVTPDKVNSIICSMLAQYEQYGLLPVWPLWSSETNCMIGYHAVPVIVDAYFKGIRGFDVEKAYEAMKTSAMQDDFGVKQLKEYGYIPYDKYNKSVSTALEYCFDDWCIARMAKDLGKEKDFEYFMKRSESYKNYFDKEYSLMNGYSSTGQFRRPFDPFYSSYGECDWVEGNSWQYSFFVPHDVPGLVRLFGSEEKFEAALDTLFTIHSGLSGDDVPIDISGLIGQYAHGNEPSHHVAYLYNYVNKPYKTQEWLNKIMTELYTDQPDGLCGNEDCGQMSAWYVFSAMGFYPVNPADGNYVFGKPMVNSAKLQIGDTPFEIVAHDLNEQNIYVRKVKLNGEDYNKRYITHKDLSEGGKLEFYMDSTPAEQN